jgi:preprotein translocase subunit SecB
MNIHQQPESYTTKEPATISLYRYNVSNIRFNVSDEVWDSASITDKSEFNMQFKPFTDANKKDFFGLNFVIKLENEEKSFSFEMEFIAHFLTLNMEIDETFIKGSFVTGNAPAIVFPYIRACITNFFQNSGYNPIILPAFNFNSVKKVEESGS